MSTMMNALLKYCLILSLLVPAYGMVAQNPDYGKASMYDDKFQDSKTASGAKYDKDKMTAAHRTLPFGTKVKVTRMDNKKSVVVTINDRGPFVRGYVIDMSRKAAEVIGLSEDTSTDVKVERVSGSAVASTANTEKGSKTTAKRKAPKEYNKPNRKPVTKKININGKVNPTGFYKVEASEQPRKGFGVQIAVFSELDHLVKRTALLRKRGFKNVLTYIYSDKGKLKYKIILGPFKSQSQAGVYKRSLKKRYGISGFSVNLAKLASK